ncbi:hypothetical protein [Geothrix sp.]|uniref:hypothetical protein n=1 Tax=Geothrix sp. TaxID=1962974 RepID=UPI0025B9402A|nr:hypothetical protein [Geothrix sp.]
MKKAPMLFQVDESRDGKLHVAVARDKKGGFLGVVSEASKEEALREVRALALEALLDQADAGHPPRDFLLQTPSSSGTSVALSLQELTPIILRYERRMRGMLPGGPLRRG